MSTIYVSIKVHTSDGQTFIDKAEVQKEAGYYQFGLACTQIMANAANSIWTVAELNKQKAEFEKVVDRLEEEAAESEEEAEAEWLESLADAPDPEADVDTETNKD